MTPPARRRTLLAWTVALTVVYGTGLVLVLGWRTPVEAGIDPQINAVIVWSATHGARWFTRDVLEFTANVALFAPLGGLLAAFLGPRLRWWAVAGGAVISAAAELGQHLLRPERVADPRDLLSNTLGALVGCVMVATCAAVRARREPAPLASVTPLHRDGTPTATPERAAA